MVKCKKCGKEILSGEKIVVQYDGIMMYEEKDAAPVRIGSLTKYWHKGCKPWKAQAVFSGGVSEHSGRPSSAA